MPSDAEPNETTMKSIKGWGREKGGRKKGAFCQQKKKIRFEERRKNTVPSDHEGSHSVAWGR